MWNPCHRSIDKYSHLYTYYAVALFIVAGMSQTTAEIVHTWRNRYNTEMFPHYFTIVSGMVSTMIKIVNVWRRKVDIEQLIDLLNYERRQPCNRSFANYRDKIITSTIRICKMLTLIFIIMVFWYGLFTYGRILIYQKGNFEMLPLSPLIPLRLNQPSLYWIWFVFDKATFFYIAGAVVSHDSLFMVFLIHLSTQLDILKERLACCHNRISRNRSDDFIEPDNKELTIECVCRTTSEELYLDPKIELRTCIEHHQQILRYSSLVQNIFARTLLLQFATSLVMITMVGFQLAGTHKLNSSGLIANGTLLACALFQLFCFCWFGTDIIEKSENIGLSAYHSKWYVADERFKSTLRIILLKGQKPIKILVSNMFELSSATFVNILTKCYSSMAMLKQVNE